MLKLKDILDVSILVNKFIHLLTKNGTNYKSYAVINIINL